MAGPNVGNISVTVDADTGRLVAQLTRAGKTAGQAAATAANKELRNLQATIDFQTQEVTNQAKILRKRVEAQLYGIPLGVDIREAQRDITALQAYAKNVDLILNAQLSDRDVASINANLRALSERAEVDAINLQVDAQMAFVEAKVDAFREYEEGEKIRLRIEADMHDAALEVFAFRELTEAQRIHQIVEFEFETAQLIVQGRQAKAELEAVMGELGIPLDVVGLADEGAELAAFRFRQEQDPINIPVDVDTRRLDAAFGDGGGGGGLSTRWKAIIGGIVLLAEPVAVALEGLLGAAVQVLSSAFSALAGPMGALIPIGGALVGSFAALTVGLQGMGDALGALTEGYSAAADASQPFSTATAEIQAALASLSPAARDFALAFADLLPTFRYIRVAVQEELFAGLDEELTNLAKTALPAIGRALGQTAADLNDFFSDLAGIAGRTDFAALFDDLRPVITDILDAFRALARSVEPFFKAAAPAARLLADSFRQTAESLGDMIAAGAKSGGLRAFLIEGVNSLKVWWDLTRNVGDALATLFDAGTEGGDSMVRSLSEIVARFDAWMESASGQSALTEFFETTRQLMSDLTPILTGLVGLFDEMVTPGAVDRFGQLTSAIGHLLPFIGQLFELIGRTQILTTALDLFGSIADALQPAMPALQNLADVIGESLGNAVETIAPALPGLVDSIVALAEAFEPVMAESINNVAVALVAMADGFSFVLQFIADIPTPLLSIATTMLMLKPILSPIASGLMGVANGLKALMVAAAAHPVLAAAFAAIALGTGIFLAQAASAQKAKDEIEEYVNALLEFDPTGLAEVGVVMENLRDEQDKTRDGFRKTGLSIREWAKGIVTGTQSAQEATADWIATLVGADDPLVDMVRSGEVSIRDLRDAMEVAGPDVEQLSGKFDTLGTALDKTGIGGNTALEMFDFLADESDELADTAVEVNRQVSEMGTGLRLSAADAELLAAGIMGAYEAADGFEARVAAAGGAAYRSAGQLDEFAGSADMNDRIDPTNVSLEDFATAAEDAGREADIAAGKAEELREQFDRFIRPTLNAAEASLEMSEAFKDLGIALTGGEEAEQKRIEAYKLMSGESGEVTEETKKRATALLAEADALTAQARALDTSTEAGAAAHQAAIDAVAGILDNAEAQAALTGNTAESALQMVGWRQTMIDTSIAAGLGEEAARNLADQYALTPDEIATRFIQSGMTDAQKEALAYVDENLNNIPDSIDTLINQPGMTEAMKNTLLLDEDMDNIPDVIDIDVTAEGIADAQAKAGTLASTVLALDGTQVAIPTAAPGSPEALWQLTVFGQKAKELDGKQLARVMASAPGAIEGRLDLIDFENKAFEVDGLTVEVPTSASGADDTVEEIDGVGAKAREVNGTAVKIPVSTTGLDAAVSGLSNLSEQIRLINGKQVTVQVARSRTGGQLIAEAGGVVPPGRPAWGGEAGAELFHLGRRFGVVRQPTLFPPGTQLTPISGPRDAALYSLLRALGDVQGPRGTGPMVDKQIINNINQTITPISSDPEAVATSVLNRMVAGIRR